MWMITDNLYYRVKTYWKFFLFKLKQDKKTQNKVTSFGTIFLQLLDHFSAPLNSKGFKNGASISFFKSLFSHSFLNTN